METYDDLIKEWFYKAENEKDYFTKFIFLFISFTAFITQKYPGLRNDCDKKKKFITEEEAKNYYNNQTLIKTDLRKCLLELVEYLDKRPIINITRKDDKWEWDGKLLNIYDWNNLVEFWFRVRNNLFHGHKSLEFERDQVLVKFAYKTLYPIMKNFINNNLCWQF